MTDPEYHQDNTKHINDDFCKDHDTDGSCWPKISIVTPSLNQGKYIEATIRSVLDQNYPNLEYIIIDGGSTDETLEIIRRYKDGISVFVCEKDKGQSDAINKGFKRASGEIVGWLNSDDIYLPSTLFLIGTLFKKFPGSDWIVGSSIIMDSKLKEVKTFHYPKSKPCTWVEFICNKYYGISLSQPPSFWSSRLIRAIGSLDTDLHYSFDYDMYCNAAFHGYRPCCMDIPLAAIRHHPESKTSKGFLPFRKEQLITVNKYMGRCPDKERYKLIWYRRYLMSRIIKLRIVGYARRYGILSSKRS